MTCQEIRNLLPGYEEDGLSLEERRVVEHHLASCPFCQQSLADLKQTRRLLQGLEEVEPPPFLEQRIMARIREEAGTRKSLLQRLFFPLHFKIPLQVTATLLIAVLAVYVFQKNKPAMGPMNPFPVPLHESAGGQKGAESPPAPASPEVTPPSRAPAKKAPAEVPLKKGQSPFSAAPQVSIGKRADQDTETPGPEPGEHFAAPKPEPPVPVLKEKKEMAGSALGKSAEGLQRPTVPRMPGPMIQERKGKSMRTDVLADKGGAAEEEQKLRAAPAPSGAARSSAGSRIDLNLTLQVKEPDRAVQEIEGRLRQINARIMEKRPGTGGISLKAEIPGQKVALFLENLGEIGRAVYEKGGVEAREGGLVVVAIHIIPFSP
jgi:hypothetical protein